MTWSSAGEYFDALDAARPAVNVLSLVPNGQLRLAVLGLVDRAADERELREMKNLLRRSLDEGAWGYSTGLEYAPEQGASEDEVTELAAVSPFYATHTRRRDAGAADAVVEALRTGDRADVRLQVSHLVPRNGLEESRRCIELVDAARERGQDVAFDMHTRTFGLTNLYAALPPWALGGDRVYEVVWEPLLRGKFGQYADEISAAWFWAKLRLRGGSRGARGEELLAYFTGGFAALADELVARIVAAGGEVRLGKAATGLVTEAGKVKAVLTGALGLGMLAGSGVLLVIGILVIRKVVSIDV